MAPEDPLRRVRYQAMGLSAFEGVTPLYVLLDYRDPSLCLWHASSTPLFTAVGILHYDDIQDANRLPKYGAVGICDFESQFSSFYKHNRRDYS